MALPSQLQVAVPVAIQNISIQYKPKFMIGEQVFPIVPVPTLQTKILKYAKANLFRLSDGELYRAEGALTKRFNYNIDTQFVNPRQISAEVPVTDELLDIASQPGQMPLQPIVDAVQLATTKIDLYKEKQISDVIYGNKWVDGTTGGTAPSGGAGSWGLDTTANTLVTDIYNAKKSVLSSTGVEPNVLIIDYATFVKLQSNPVISDKIKYTEKAVFTADLLASLLQLDEVLIGRGIYTSQKENKNATNATFSGTSIWNPSGKGNAFLYYREAPGLRALSAGFQFRLPYMGSMRYVRGYRDEQVRSTVYQVTEQVEIAPVALDVGYAWTTTISA